MSYPPQPPDPSQEFWRQVVSSQQAQPQAMPYQGMPPQPPKKKRAGLVAGLIGGGAVLIIAIATVAVFVASNDGAIEAGDCAGAESNAEGAPLFEAECGSSDSSYRVLAVLDRELTQKEADEISLETCPGDFYQTQDGHTYCTGLDVEVGDCLSEWEENRAPVKVACSRSGADRVKLVKNVNDKGVCGKDDGWYSSEKPPLTVCFNDA